MGWMNAHEPTISVRVPLPIYGDIFRVKTLGHFFVCIEKFEFEFRVPRGLCGLW